MRFRSERMGRKVLGKRFVKVVKKRVPWIGHIIDDPKIAGDLNLDHERIDIQAYEGSLCLICRGSRRLCGKPKCPALVRLYSLIKVKKMINGIKIFGSSPPGIFVGRIGYPYVYAGPLVPPIVGDTSLMDSPEEWIGKTVDEIVGFRTSLVRGRFKVNVKKPERAGRLMDQTLELALAREPVETDVVFRKRLSGRFLFDGEVQPMGPSAPLRSMEVGSSKTDHRIEKAYSDADLRAEEAILSLYRDGVPVSKIQRAFSVGVFGVKRQRRLVPTRWSITAVDSTISRRLIEDQVKGRPTINEYRVYEFSYLGNRFLVLFMPGGWSYEWIEAWHPKTAWNPMGGSIAMGGDWEGYKGRTSYASIGGCYYAVRLAVAEYLAEERRQAKVVAMREIHPGFLMPLGVWINRECVREALRRGFKRFETIDEALAYVGSRFSVGIKHWIDLSVLIRDELYQARITEYI